MFPVAGAEPRPTDLHCWARAVAALPRVRNHRGVVRGKPLQPNSLYGATLPQPPALRLDRHS